MRYLAKSTCIALAEAGQNGSRPRGPLSPDCRLPIGLKRSLQDRCTVTTTILGSWQEYSRQSVEHASEAWGLIVSTRSWRVVSGCGVGLEG